VTEARLSLLLSGAGRTLENLARQVEQGEVPARIEQVISSHANVLGLERARRLGLPAELIDYREFGADGAAFSAAVSRAVDAVAPDLVVMAGFIRKWDFAPSYEGRVMNIHPALLPAFGGKGFYGMHVHRAVLAAGVKFSGCTVHFVDDEYDHGPVILQRVIPVLPGETPEGLAERVFAEECVAYPEAIRYFAEGRLRVEDGRVTILPDS
jgi:formyltetrahydrofolate-dependent phosphoribosylglycinamide formyltransferase